MAKLISVHVSELLGQFDHSIKFPAAWDFAIVHGPNGVGKTKLLELIEATMKQRPRRVAAIPFKQLVLNFDDGSVLEVSKEPIEEAGGPDLDLRTTTVMPRFSFSSPGMPTETWVALRPSRVSLRDVARLENVLGLRIKRLGPELWGDPISGRAVTLEELVDRHYDLLYHGSPGPVEAVKPPKQVYDFLHASPIHLIETQRLLNAPEDRGVRGGRDEDRLPTVHKYAADLASKLREAMTENSRVSQKLDSSFPRRVLVDVESGNPVTEDEIRARYNEQNELRERLADIAVLDAAPEVPLPDRKLEDWERIFLWKYLEDTHQKLSSFENLLVRARLFREIVNSRFLFKTMSIDRQYGFKFVTNSGQEIAATDLSSGEQHEIVLAYGLLFMVEPGSLVLIDEPEISLHVSWQQNFISDIGQISEIANLRFLVATHSPQVIHHWIDRTITLAAEFGEG